MFSKCIFLTINCSHRAGGKSGVWVIISLMDHNQLREADYDLYEEGGYKKFHPVTFPIMTLIWDKQISPEIVFCPNFLLPLWAWWQMESVKFTLPARLSDVAQVFWRGSSQSVVFDYSAGRNSLTRAPHPTAELCKERTVDEWNYTQHGNEGVEGVK